MGTFKDLRVWNDAVQLAVVVYEVTEGFPGTERFGLTSQLRRAAISVSSNLAEGKGRASGKELCRFLDIAIGSLCEVESQFEVAIALGFIKRPNVSTVATLIDQIGRGLTNLRKVHQR